VIIVGGGPTGLSAALVLGRCRRSVVLVDSGEYRNAASHAMHNFLSRDGTDPAELRRLGRADLNRYPSVQLRQGRVVDLDVDDHGFSVILADTAEPLVCRRLLLAAGMVDELPKVPGLVELYGKSVFHCPYCDGFEVADQPLVAYGRGGPGMELAFELTTWSRDIVLCTDGPSDLSSHELARLGRNGIAVRKDRIARLEGSDGILSAVVFAGGELMARRALFFITNEHQASPLPARLGCSLTSQGAVRTGPYETTEVQGLYVAGDASRSVQAVIVAAAEGAEAAFSINDSLLKEDLE